MLRSIDELKADIEALAFLESLVHLPDKPRDPDWPHWVARATVDGKSFSGKGDTAEEALERLLESIQTGDSTFHV